MLKAAFVLFATLVACCLAVEPVTEHVAIVKTRTPEDVVALINSGISLDHPNKKHQTFEAYLTEKDFATLNALNLEYEIQTKEHVEEKRAVNGVAYHDYNALTAFIENIAAQYPTITKLFTIGKSVQGRELWGIQISDNIDENEAEPQFKYIANMHGDEVVGREISLYFIELLCSQYGISDRISRLVNETNIYIIPSMNPDGFERRQRGNARGIDINRDFPDQFFSIPNTKTGRQPEVAAVMNFVEQNNFVLSANFHGGAVVANYPYDGTADQRNVYSASPDDAVFKHLALTYSNKHKSMHDSWEFTNGITNGAEWYVLYGGMQDWNYVYNQGIFEITIELSDIKWPSASTLPGHWDDNREAMLSYMELVHQIGVRGVVKNSSGLPLAATIAVKGNTKVIKTNPNHGDYYRLLTPGSYSVTASADGYVSVTKQVVIPENQVAQVVLDFALAM